MRILFTVVGGVDLAFQSGRPFYVRQALQRFADVEVLALPQAGVVAKACNRALSIGGLGNRLPDRSPSLLRTYADLVSRALQQGRHDVVVSSTTLITAVRRTGVPTATWADAPLPAVLNDLHYPGFARVGQRRQKVAMQAEAQALGNATIGAFPSQWAADLALGINPHATIRVHPFGPNIDDDLRREVLERRAAGSRSGPLRILFNGVDWRRKGGDIALEVVEHVMARTGKDVHLLVLGLDPPRAVSTGSSVTFLGRVSKATHAGRRMWIDAYSDADLFLFPTRSENYGAVVAEAAACGIPVVVSQVGGAWQSVVRGGFGHVVPAFSAQEVGELADAVIAILTDPRHATELGDAGITAVDEWLNYEHSARMLIRDLGTS